MFHIIHRYAVWQQRLESGSQMFLPWCSVGVGEAGGLPVTTALRKAVDANNKF